MKRFAIVCSAVYALGVTADVFAQTRGPNYNPPSRSSGSSSSGSSRPSSSSSSSRPSSSSSRGPSYNPPSRPSTPSSSSSSSSSSSYSRPAPASRPSYNPPSRPSSPSTSPSSPTTTGPRYNPPSTSTPSSPSTPVTGPSYNPPRPSTVNAPVRGPSYNPPVSHTPVSAPVRGPRYNNPRDYYNTIPHYYVYRRWVQYPVMYWYSNGYWDIDGYPYYVNNGYRYRYSREDLCQYELVDSQNWATVRTFNVQYCSAAYDECALERDTMNRSVSLDRYFCAEAVDKELEATDTTQYQSSAVVMTDAKQATIASYLEDMSFKDIFHDAFDYDVNNCTIEQVGGLWGSGNTYGCKYQVYVSGKGFPNVDGSICSDSNSASKINCNVGNEKANAGCIMKKAIESGYCH